MNDTALQSHNIVSATQARSLADTTVAIVGLGYVGLPLAVEFGKLFNTIGFDLSRAKVES